MTGSNRKGSTAGVPICYEVTNASRAKYVKHWVFVAGASSGRITTYALGRIFIGCVCPALKNDLPCPSIGSKLSFEHVIFLLNFLSASNDTLPQVLRSSATCSKSAWKLCQCTDSTTSSLLTRRHTEPN